jgi:hypothetical protein
VPAGNDRRGRAPGGPADALDQLEALGPRGRLLRDLRTTEHGLSSREAARRLVQQGPNVLAGRGGVRWPREIARQLTHPLALLLWVAAALSFAVGGPPAGTVRPPRTGSVQRPPVNRPPPPAHPD